MEFMDTVMEWWQRLWSQVSPYLEKIGGFFSTAAGIFGRFFRGVFRVRKIIAMIPVVALTIYLAIYNAAHLPEIVGIYLLADGSFGIQIARVIAVLTPPLLTGLCLLLMFASRRILTPWLVSMFSLIIPVLILITNIFPS